MTDARKSPGMRHYLTSRSFYINGKLLYFRYSCSAGFPRHSYPIYEGVVARLFHKENRNRIIPRREPKFEVRRAVSANARHRKIEFMRIYDPLWIRELSGVWDRRFTARRVRSKNERVRGGSFELEF